VVIQEMVASEMAGVAFSVHPVSEDPDEMIIEAEEGVLVAPMQIAQDPNASNGEYIYVPNGAEWQGSAVFKFNVENAGDYHIWGKVLAVDWQDNSFFVNIDNTVDKLWTVQTNNKWTWDAVNSEDGQNPAVFSLAQGEHILKIKRKDDGTKLDKIVITNNLGLNLQLEEILDVDEVWSGHPVGFSFLTHNDHQFVAYYDKDRYMTIASRTLGSDQWNYKRLPSQVGWDSHNSITMAIDDNEDLHVAGNMHCSPLNYYRTTRPLDISSLQKFSYMVGTSETSVTYPRFLRCPNNEFLFTYRQGGSGDGENYYNIYSHTRKSWSRFFDTPLFDGEGTRNAYAIEPVKDENGIFHIAWTWRENSYAETNHDICYAKTGDLMNWETASGRRIFLPITNGEGDIIDPVPMSGGIMNGFTYVGFDTKGRTIVSYIKYDTEGNTQIYNARFENQRWKIYQTSDWNDRWEISGRGSLQFMVRLGPITLLEDGTLIQSYSHWIEGGGIWILNEETLKPIGLYPKENKIPSEIKTVETECEICEQYNEKMSVATTTSTGNASYFMRWERLPSNQDKPKEFIAPPSQLRVYKLRTNGSCSDLGGNICSSLQTCSGSWLNASDSERCCDGECKIIECQELWQCGAWSKCSNGQQTRICLDSNNCGTTENKPVEVQSCSQSCSDLGGNICSSSQTCSGSWLNASDSERCCDGECLGFPTTETEIEAEDGVLTLPMQAVRDYSASNGEYIYVPNGAGNGGEALYTFYVEKAGNYVVSGKTLAINGVDDSFFVEIDGSGGSKKWFVQQSSVWQWDLVNNKNTGEDPVIFSLSKGEHTLKVRQREDGTKLDKLMITSNINANLN